MGGYTIVGCFTVIVIFSSFAYFSYGQDLIYVDLFTQRDPLQGSKDIPMIIFKIRKFTKVIN